ncbi:MAG: hypothetical protein Q9163_003309 [Psora crenata]
MSLEACHILGRDCSSWSLQRGVPEAIFTNARSTSIVGTHLVVIISLHNNIPAGIDMSVITIPRHPLGDTTNSPPPSPPATSKRSGQTLRRRSTQQALNQNLDSSESYPSAHSSLYEASLQYEGQQQEEPLILGASCWDPPPLGPSSNELPSWQDTVAGPDGVPVPASFLKPIAPYVKDHTPHRLYPITEQNSFATLRSRTSSNLTLRARSPGLNGKHKKSFSLTDLPPAPEQDQRSSESSVAPPPSPLPQPNMPIYPPPSRSPTPPNLPSFGKPEALSYRLPPPPKPSGLRQRLGSPTPEELEWRRQTVGLPKGVVMRGEGGVLVRGKFVGIRSGHLPPQRQRHEVLGLPDSTRSERQDVGPSGRGRATQVEEARTLHQQLLDECEREKKIKRAKRKEIWRKILLCGCPWEVDASGNEVGVAQGFAG